MTKTNQLNTLGSILIEMGKLTQDELNRLEKEFCACRDELLGEFIVKHTKLTIDDIEMAMIKYKFRNSGISRHDVNKMLEKSNKSHDRVKNSIDKLIVSISSVMDHN